MTASFKSNAIGQEVSRLLADNDWSQKELADQLGVTQGHLSKVLNGVVQPGSRLRERIRTMPRRARKSRIEPWLESVRSAGAKSRDAKAAIEAIARLVNQAE